MQQRTLQAVAASATSVALLLVVPAGLSAQGGFNAADEAELKAVVLTIGSVEKLVNTIEAYVTLLKTDEALLDEVREGGEGEEGPDEFSLDGIASAMGRMPAKVQAAMTSQGLSPRQYVVLSTVAIVNGLAYAGSGTGRTDGPLPPGASLANIEFIRKNAGHPLFVKYRTLIAELEELEDGGGA